MSQLLLSTRLDLRGTGEMPPPQVTSIAYVSTSPRNLEMLLSVTLGVLVDPLLCPKLIPDLQIRPGLKNIIDFVFSTPPFDFQTNSSILIMFRGSSITRWAKMVLGFRWKLSFMLNIMTRRSRALKNTSLSEDLKEREYPFLILL